MLSHIHRFLIYLLHIQGEVGDAHIKIWSLLSKELLMHWLSETASSESKRVPDTGTLGIKDMWYPLKKKAFKYSMRTGSNSVRLCAEN